ncbi:hypothetical protein HYALB_00004483 [Hymenoscyphus albidus]|uniref:NAD(P)-binding protein n=1 Tax=Hymenoscyphus albidus TaxID=595503 RepID=A0A9N9LW66_9HELO|nr:hypothetical protein HYALB_00004483 [Hymenoscyphus albidus]
MAKGISFNPSKDIPSLAGKVILITGGNLGLGKQTAIDLAKHSPSELWIAARSADSGHATVAEIKKASPDVLVNFLHLDLSSFKSIKEAMRTFLDSVSRLDLLYLNAGIMGGTHFGTNHMGHALLFKLLKPLLLKTASVPGAGVRTITVSSAGHRFGKEELLLESMKSSAENLSPVDKYCHSKLVNAIYAHALAKYVPQITSVSVYPGDIQTGLFSSNGGSWMISFLRNIVVPLTSVSVEEGVKNQLWAGTAKGVEDGLYYEPIGVAGKASPQAQSDDLAEKLYEWTEKELEGHAL